MASVFGDLAERFTQFRERHNVSPRMAQMAVAGAVALVVLIAAVVALPRTKTKIASNRTTTAAGNDSAGASTGSGSAPAVLGTSSAGTKSTQSGSTVSASGVGSRAGSSIGGAPAVPPGVNAAGVTNTEIRVGAIYDRTAGSLNKAYGFAGIGQIDQKAAYEHVRDYINAHGGIGGRKIQLVWYSYDETTASQESIAQGACTTWTQQTRVFAALAGGDDTIDSCLSKAGIVQSDGGVSLFDSKTFHDYPYYVHLGAPGMDRLAQLYVDQMHAAGFYARGRNDQPKLPFKLGVVSWDDPIFARAIAAFRKALSRYGITLTDVAQVRRYHSAQEISDSVAGIQSAVLKFKTDNVSHVQFLSTANAFEQLTFWQFADQQKYYPRYGLTSQDAAQALITTLGAANGNGSADRTFKDSVGIGWFPLFDVPRADYSGSRESQALRLCRQILSYETFDDASRNKEAIASATCDPMFYLKAAIERGGRIVNQHSWLQGVATVPRLSSALTFDMQTSASRRDGMNAIRDDQYYSDCTCFHYTSGLKKV